LAFEREEPVNATEDAANSVIPGVGESFDGWKAQPTTFSRSENHARNGWGSPSKRNSIKRSNQTAGYEREAL
jgi:hypothetical protein